MYFQLPLMILLMIPVIEGLRKEWRESASNLGASSFEFWRYVGLPVVAPSLLGLMVLLFGNAFSAYATAQTLGVSNLVTDQTLRISFTETSPSIRRTRTRSP